MDSELTDGEFVQGDNTVIPINPKHPRFGTHDIDDTEQDRKAKQLEDGEEPLDSTRQLPAFAEVRSGSHEEKILYRSMKSSGKPYGLTTLKENLSFRAICELVMTP